MPVFSDPCLADRFVPRAGTWIDLASGAVVRIRFSPTGSTAEQLAWNGSRATLANLRHPLVNPLIDFGVAGSGRMFEAYAAGTPVHASGAAAARLLRHATRFLEAHEAVPTDVPAGYLFRPIVAGRASYGRPLGLAIQRRAVLDAIVDALDVARPGGACAIEVRGRPHSGLRTLRLLAARAARQHGYVPASSTIARAGHGVLELFRDRHVCLLVDGEDPDAGTGAAAVLSQLSGAGARRHVVLTFRRTCDRESVRAIPVDTMGVTAMTRMVFVDPEDGPAPGELFAAARGAEGRPGLFVARLGADTFAFSPDRSGSVHETSAGYLVLTPQGATPAGARQTRRTAAVALRSAHRADTLARHGRHAAAARLLSRAVRLLRARGELTAAAGCAELRGWLALDRADVDGAVEAFEEARALGADTAAGVGAAIGVGVAWIEDTRFAEAEAVLRNALLAARTLRNGAMAARAAAALGRCLYWQGRRDEAAAAVTETFDGGPAESDRARIAGVAARVHLAERAIPSAMRAARQALELATAAADPRALIGARRVLAATLLASGDPSAAVEQVRIGLRMARDAHLPLAAVRLRVSLLDLLTAMPSEHAAARRLSARLLASAPRVPTLLRFQIRAACARSQHHDLDPDVDEFIRSAGACPQEDLARQANVVAELEALLEIGHTASDDRTALDRMCEALVKKLRAGTVLVATAWPERRVLVSSGRAWPGEPSAVWRAFAAGGGIPPDAAMEPFSAAEVLRYGGTLIGAVGCRWVAGTIVDVGRAMALLHVAALAMAPHARGLLDRVVPESTSVTWKDLLGDSPPAQALRDAIARAARAPFPVLIEGESGSGKELVARAIHRLGSRRDRRFCAINCAALSDDLLEAELFGHARGAFTGAVGERAGLFEDADGGTLFLDEIGELSARAQAKLLRVLQDGEVRRVGENVSRKVDVRIVAATNRRLEHEAAAGRFRPDLRFRLDVVRIEVPPLRERASDVPLLASHFWTDASTRMGSRATLSPDALAALTRYDWPGNVRELQNVIAWMAVHSPRRGRIGPAGLPAHLAQCATPAGTTFEAAREEFERRFVRAALASANGHRMRAAESMGITRQGLAKMLRRLGIEGG